MIIFQDNSDYSVIQLLYQISLPGLITLYFKKHQNNKINKYKIFFPSVSETFETTIILIQCNMQYFFNNIKQISFLPVTIK